MARRDRAPLWAYLALGALAVGFLGLLWSWLRRHRARPLAGPGTGPTWMQPGGSIHISGPVTVNLPGGLYGPPSGLYGPPALVPQAVTRGALPVAAPSAIQMALPSSVSRSTTMRSTTVDADTSRRVFTASGNTGWVVEVKVVEPPGSFAQFTVNAPIIGAPGALAQDAFTVGTNGGSSTIHLAPGDILYAKGSMDGVTVAISASPDPRYG